MVNSEAPGSLAAPKSLPQPWHDAGAFAEDYCASKTRPFFDILLRFSLTPRL